jgi:hypothetical protein
MKLPMTCSMRRTLSSTLLVPFLGAVVLSGCRPSQPESDTTAQRPQPSASDSQVLVTPPHLGAVTAQPNTSTAGKMGPKRPGVGDSGASLRANGPIPTKARRGDAATAESLTVASFLDRSMDAGRQVQVTGTCLDQFHARGSAGPPPVSRSDWQLASGTRVVYVVGRMPVACSAGSLTLAATVAIDTTLVSGRREPRRYLVVSR